MDVNDNEPTFSKNDLSLANKAWEKYGDLDKLNRATSAEAMLNQSTMPEGDEERGDISNVEPTGWKNKKIKSGYLYNRSHLIGWALSAENDNWKNLITGTRQLNSPEMQRFEMDVKYYLEQSKDNYVRYSVTPIFRGDEELARGVHMMAQSVGDDEISFNKYVFNVQDGVTLDYSDGTSQVDENMQVAEDQEKAKQEAEENNEQPEEQPVQEEPSGEQYVDENGNGLIKGSKSKIYHVPGSQYYDQTTNPERTFKSIEEAEDAGYRAPK
ncbi:DNA/RNA non-specific endonuclease [Tetragenococcus halophilus]|nr:DNA/RNA non-specific endonuclease [Tetragenococcus halophilus]